MPPPLGFLGFFQEDKTSAPEVFSRCSFIPRTHFEKSSVNLSLSTGIVPCDWKEACVFPLYKSGGHASMDNYRPISILPVMSKIMEKAVNVQLQRYLQRFDLLSPFQAGFRQHHSTESAVLYFTDEIRRSAESGKLTGACLLI